MSKPYVIDFRVYDLTYGPNGSEANWKKYHKLEILPLASQQPLITLQSSLNIPLENPKKLQLKTFTTYCHFLRALPEDEYDMPVPKDPLPVNRWYLVIEDISIKKTDTNLQTKYQILVLLPPKEWDQSETKQTLRQILITLNNYLMFSKEGFLFDFTERFKLLIYKCTKEIFSLIVSKQFDQSVLGFVPVGEVLTKLSNSTEPTATLCPDIIREGKNLIYTTLLSYGVFPAFIEISTKGEHVGEKLRVKVVELMTNESHLPWGAIHYTSFILGDRRFSFVNNPYQMRFTNRLLVTDLKLRSWRKIHENRDIFQLRLFSFFPLDSWTHQIWEFIALKIYPKGPIFKRKDTLKKFTLYNCKQLATQLADEFYNEYIQKFPPNTWQQFLIALTDLQFSSYSIRNNNNQTIVSKLLYIFSQTLQRYAEPKTEINISALRLLYGKKKCWQVLHQTLNKFGKNEQLQKIVLFNLKNKLDYLGYYADELTKQYLSSKKYDNLKKNTQGEEYKKTLKEFYKEFCASHISPPKLIRLTLPEDETEKIDRRTSTCFVDLEEGKKGEKPKENNEEGEKRLEGIIIYGKKIQSAHKFEKGSDIYVRLEEAVNGKAKDYQFLHYLFHCVFNDLFKLKRSIKIIKGEKSEVEENIIDEELLQALKEKEEELDQIITTNSSGVEKKIKKKEIEEIQQFLIEIQTQRTGKTEQLAKLCHDKKQLKFIFHEICFYFYNCLRTSLLKKKTQDMTYIGSIIMTNPEEPGRKFIA